MVAGAVGPVRPEARVGGRGWWSHGAAKSSGSGVLLVHGAHAVKLGWASRKDAMDSYAPNASQRARAPRSVRPRESRSRSLIIGRRLSSPRVVLWTSIRQENTFDADGAVIADHRVIGARFIA